MAIEVLFDIKVHALGMLNHRILLLCKQRAFARGTILHEITVYKLGLASSN